MTTGHCARIDELPGDVRVLFDEARRAVLTTIGADGAPHSVPVCFAVRDDDIVTEIDRKPKDPTRTLARVRNIELDARVTLLVDRWDEDWTRLCWIMVRGIARIEEPGGRTAELLAQRYQQYREQPPDGRVIAIAPARVTWWRWT